MAVKSEKFKVKSVKLKRKTQEARPQSGAPLVFSRYL